MAGSKAGGKNAARTNKERFGEDFYKVIGRKGGSVLGTKGGYASDKVGADGLTGVQRARKYGVIGGKKSRKPQNG